MGGLRVRRGGGGWDWSLGLMARQDWGSPVVRWGLGSWVLCSFVLWVTSMWICVHVFSFILNFFILNFSELAFPL